MAHLLQTSNFVCRGCRLALGRAPRGTRPFSNTASQRKTIVEFAPTSSPELDAIFTRYRETLFIPSILSETHRRLIYRPTRHVELTNEPGVTVTLPNDEDVKLKPMKLEDRPVKRKTLSQIRSILRDTQDNEAWNNLLPFLEGMHAAKQSIAESFLASIARAAGQQGKLQAVMRCVEVPKRTNLRLCMPEVTRELLLACHIRAANAGFKGEDFLSAAKQAEQIAVMMEKREHCGGKLRPGDVDMRQSLMVAGVLLEMAAAKATEVSGGKDVDGQVASYVAKTMALSSESQIKDRVTTQYNITPDKTGTLTAHGWWLTDMLPLWYGMQLTTKVEGGVPPEVQDSFNQRLTTLYREIQAAASEFRKDGEHSAGKTPRPLIMFNQLKD